MTNSKLILTARSRVRNRMKCILLFILYLNSVSYSTPCHQDQLTVYQIELDTSLIPRTYSPFKIADRRGGKRQVTETLNTSKNRSSVQKSSKVQCFSLLVYHFMALAFPVNIPLVFNNLIYFLSERFFPKNREIGSLVGRP